MGAPSSYLKYLPPVLWSGDAEARSLPLGQMLSIFEKFLTGIDDGVVIPAEPPAAGRARQTAAYAPLQDTIADSVRLFKAWQAPAGGGAAGAPAEGTALDWLAQWVALRQSPDWSEYQRRRAVSQIVQIYARHGTKEGLNRLVELYAGSSLRPRVVVDDASKILLTKPSASGMAPIHTLVSQLPLVAPQSIACGPDGNLYAADLGNENLDFPGLPPPQKPAFWRLSRLGQVRHKNGKPEPLIVANQKIPWAVATDRLNPFGIYCLDGRRGNAQLFRVASNASAPPETPFAAGATIKSPSIPAGMLVTADNRLLILDRDVPDDMKQGSRLIEVALTGSNPPAIAGVREHKFADILAPLSMVQRRDGSIVIGDGGDQTVAAPGKLWTLDPDAGFPPVLLYGETDMALNPLVSPTGIAEDEDGGLLILDCGLKPFEPDAGHPFNSLIARQAAVYRFADGKVRRVSETQQLVYPRGMTRGPDGTLYICDTGLPDIAYNSRAWRSLPLAFTVVVHFEGQIDTRPEDLPARRKLFRSIRDVIATEHPAQSHWTLQSETDIG